MGDRRFTDYLFLMCTCFGRFTLAPIPIDDMRWRLRSGLVGSRDEELSMLACFTYFRRCEITCCNGHPKKSDFPNEIEVLDHVSQVVCARHWLLSTEAWQAS